METVVAGVDAEEQNRFDSILISMDIKIVRNYEMCFFNFYQS